MKPSERANEIWDEYSVTVVSLPNPMRKKIQDAIEAAEQKALQDGYTMGWGDRVRNDARTPEEAYEEWKQEQGEGLTTK